MNNNNTTINQMPSTRSGKVNYKVGPEHQGRFAVAHGTFATGPPRKRKVDEPHAGTRLRMTQGEDRQKRGIQMVEPSPPTPTKDQLVQLTRAFRQSKPSCLHYGIDRGTCEILYPDLFFCGNCEAYAEAMIHSSRKSLIKKESARFKCQADHTSYIFPTTKKAKTESIICCSTASRKSKT
jgi:hypothetical protein